MIVFISSCEFLGLTSKKSDDPLFDPHNTPTCRYIDYDHDTKTGIRIMYYESGKKKSYVFFDHGMRDSLFRTWHENGKKKLVIWYEKGMKQGLYQKFRKTGELYREIEYEDDMKNGSYKEFWKNGRVKYELEYRNDLSLDKTLQEYKQDGNVRPGSFLVINEVNTVRKNNKYALYVYFDDLPEEAVYVAIIDGIPFALEKVSGKGVLSFDVPEGAFLMKKVVFEGFYQGRKRTVRSVKRSFSIGIENQ